MPATLTVPAVRMNTVQRDAYLEYKTLKEQIADLNRQVAELEKQKKLKIGIFGQVFTDKIAEAKAGRINVVRIKQHRDVKAHSYDFFEYKEK